MIQKIFLIFLIGILLPFSNNYSPQTEETTFKEQIEAGFLFFGKSPVYGLNINTTPGEVRFRITKSGSYRIFLIESERNNKTTTLAGINNLGRFIAGQTFQEESLPNFDRLYNNSFIQNFLSNDNITDIKQWLNTQEEISRLAGNKFLLSLPESKAGLVEISHNSFEFMPTEDNYDILLPVPNTFYTDSQPQNILGPDYRAIHEFLTLEILENIDNQDLNTHFSMAHQVKNNPEDSISLIAFPNQNQIYITINNDPTKIWMINLDGGTIETYEGFEQLHKGNLTAIGITSKDLFILNFSNESLMIGIIFAASAILIIIGLSVFITIRKQTKTSS